MSINPKKKTTPKQTPSGDIPDLPKPRIKIIKINLWWVLIGVFVAIVLLRSLYNRSFGSDTVEVVNQEHKVSLDTFLSGYEANMFTKLTLTNGTELAGYVPVSGSLPTSLSFQTIKDISIQTYDLYKTSKPLETSLHDMGINFTGTKIDIKYEKESFLTTLLVNSFPLLILLGLLLLVTKFLGGKGGLGGFNPFGSMMNIGKLANGDKNDTKVRFSDVIGMEEVKQELTEVVDFLKNPAKYHKLGAKIPRGVLLYGGPGVGKTLLAKAVAGEAGVAFFSVSGSEFMEMLVGMGASKVRTLFDKARSAGKAIIFIDEIDAIGKKRGGGMSGGHQEQEQTLNQILTEMDGFDTDTNVIVLASTNRPDTLDPALLRSGRFDRKVLVNTPSKEERKAMFEYYLNKKKIDKDINIDSIVNRSSGMAGADIENIVNEAALKAARDNSKKITNDDLNYAIEKVVMGPERRTKVVTEEMRKLVAYHELGHAVTSYFLKYADKLERITIVPRGQSLGATRYSPEEDLNLVSKAQFLDKLVSLLGGRAAEEIFVGGDNITTGASNDFERATKIAADMILKYGMDPEMGTIMYLDKSEDQSAAHFRRYSDKTTEMADAKIKKLIADAYEKAKTILSDHKSEIEAITNVLLERESLSREEFEAMMVQKDHTNLEKGE